MTESLDANKMITQSSRQPKFNTPPCSIATHANEHLSHKLPSSPLLTNLNACYHDDQASRALNLKLQVSIADLKSQISNHRSQITSLKLQISNCKSQITDLIHRSQ